MTRINVVPVGELCDQHLLAEFRELTRIPNGLLSGKLEPHYPDAPKEYTLGKGHVKFFVNKLSWLSERYSALFDECWNRGFKVKYIWPVYEKALLIPDKCWNDYTPTHEALALNRARILERMPAKPRFTKYN